MIFLGVEIQIRFSLPVQQTTMHCAIVHLMSIAVFQHITSIWAIIAWIYPVAPILPCMTPQGLSEYLPTMATTIHLFMQSMDLAWRHTLLAQMLFTFKLFQAQLI